MESDSQIEDIGDRYKIKVMYCCVGHNSRNIQILLYSLC